MPVNNKWFKAKLAERQLSQRGLAKLMGMDAAAVSLMLRGRREMKIQEAAELARLLGVPAEEVMANAGVKVRSKGETIPVIGTMDGHGEVTWGESKKLGTVPRPSADLPANAVAIQCRTAGTDLDYMDRWVLIAAEPTDDVNPESIERMSVLKLRKGITAIGQVRRGYKRGRWDLSGPLGTAKDVDLEYATPILLIVT